MAYDKCRNYNGFICKLCQNMYKIQKSLLQFCYNLAT